MGRVPCPVPEPVLALRYIETDIEIAAPASAVWDVLSDLARWPEWHPFVTRISGELSPGKRIVLRKAAGGGRTLTVRQKVVAVEDGTEFRVAGRLGVGGLLDNEHRFRVEAVDEARSRFFNGQAFRGVLVRLLIRRRGQASYDVYEEINRALKKRVESLRRPA